MKLKRIISIIFICLCITGCKEKTYTVTFDTNGGTVLKSIALTKGSNISNITPPTKEGYVFVNWLKDGIDYKTTTPVTENIILKANWVKAPDLNKTHKVIFNFGDKTETVTVNDNDTVKELSTEAKENHKFLGWYVGESKYNFTKPVTKDLLLVAKYEKEKLTIKFDLSGGNGINSKTMNKGDKLEKPNNPTKIGYKFIQWELNGKEYDFDLEVKENMTLKAIWRVVEYVTVEFISDGIIFNSEVIEKGTSITNVTNPSKTGFVFKEWQLNGSPFDLNDSINENITLTALFEAE